MPGTGINSDRIQVFDTKEFPGRRTSKDRIL